MPFSLINPDEIVTIEIKGNPVSFKRLKHGDNLRLMSLGQKIMINPDNKMVSEACDIMAGYITAIDAEGDIRKVLDGLYLSDFLAIMGEMTAKSTLSEEQVKN